MAKSFRFPRWVEKTRTYSIHPVAFIDQPVATPHQPRYAQQLPPGGSQGGCAARVARLATPTRLKSFWLAAANRIPPIHYSLLSITFAHAGGRGRAGQGTNVSIQAPCGIIRRHCRPAQKLSVYKRVVTGEVQEPTDRYKLRASLSGGTAALVCISFREAWPRLVFFTFTGYNALVTFLKGAFRCKQKKMK